MTMVSQEKNLDTPKSDFNKSRKLPFVETVNRLNRTGFAIIDEWIASLLLAGLPEHFLPTIMAFKHSGIKTTVDVIKSKLVDMEVSNPLTTDTSGAAFDTKNNHRNKNSKTKNGGRGMSASMSKWTEKI